MPMDSNFKYDVSENNPEFEKNVSKSETHYCLPL